MRGRFRVVVEVIAFLALAGFAVGPEKFFELREQIRLGTEMRKMPIAGGLGLFHRLAERGAVQAVEAVTLDDLRVNLFATEDMFERAFDRGGAGAAGAGDGDDRVFFGHLVPLRTVVRKEADSTSGESVRAMPIQAQKRVSREKGLV